MAQKSRDAWKDHIPPQPKECSGCGKPQRISKDTMQIARYPEAITTCKDCLPFTVLLSYDGCEYCKLAVAAIEDARDEHRRAA